MTSKATRRGFTIGAAALVITRPALAQSAYPDKPIKVILPFGPGGLADVTVRVVGEQLGTLLGQQIVVVNQPGANGVTALKSVQSAPADGYTLALLTNGTAITHALSKTPAFDPAKDFVPISSLGFFDFVFVTKADAPFKTLGEFLAAARVEPGKLNIGTINVGSSQNLSAALFKTLTGIDVAVVPFRTTPDVMTAVLRGDVQLAIDGYSAAKSLIADRQLRALAASGPVRSRQLPDVPTAGEAGIKDFEVTSWNALFAAAGTPPDAITALNAKLQLALAHPAVTVKLAELGIEARGGTPTDIQRRFLADIAKWSAVIDKAGIAKQ